MACYSCQCSGGSRVRSCGGPPGYCQVIYSLLGIIRVDPHVNSRPSTAVGYDVIATVGYDVIAMVGCDVIAMVGYGVQELVM